MDDQPSIEVCDEVVRDGVGDDVDSLDDGQTVPHFTHDDGDRRFQGVSDRREDLRAGLFLAALNLTQVAKSNTGFACDLTKGAPLLQTEVPENVTDFLTN